MALTSDHKYLASLSFTELMDLFKAPAYLHRGPPTVRQIVFDWLRGSDQWKHLGIDDLVQLGQYTQSRRPKNLESTLSAIDEMVWSGLFGTDALVTSSDVTMLSDAVIEFGPFLNTAHKQELSSRLGSRFQEASADLGRLHERQLFRLKEAFKNIDAQDAVMGLVLVAWRRRETRIRRMTAGKPGRPIRFRFSHTFLRSQIITRILLASL